MRITPRTWQRFHRTYLHDDRVLIKRAPYARRRRHTYYGIQFIEHKEPTHTESHAHICPGLLQPAVVAAGVLSIKGCNAAGAGTEAAACIAATFPGSFHRLAAAIDNIAHAVTDDGRAPQRAALNLNGVAGEKVGGGAIRRKKSGGGGGRALLRPSTARKLHTAAHLRAVWDGAVLAGAGGAAMAPYLIFAAELGVLTSGGSGRLICLGQRQQAP